MENKHMFRDLLRIRKFERLRKCCFQRVFLALTAASDSKCTSKGGRCQDCSQNKCTAGYEQYLCDGTKLELFFFSSIYTENAASFRISKKLETIIGIIIRKSPCLGNGERRNFKIGQQSQKKIPTSTQSEVLSTPRLSEETQESKFLINNYFDQFSRGYLPA